MSDHPNKQLGNDSSIGLGHIGKKILHIVIKKKTIILINIDHYGSKFFKLDIFKCASLDVLCYYIIKIVIKKKHEH